MGKHKTLQNYHLYLGLGGILAVSALVVALTFGLSSAQTPPTGGDMGGYTGGGSYTPPPPPPSGDMGPPPAGGTGGSYTPPPPPPAGGDGGAGMQQPGQQPGGQMGQYQPQPGTGGQMGGLVSCPSKGGEMVSPQDCANVTPYCTSVITTNCKPAESTGGQMGQFGQGQQGQFGTQPGGQGTQGQYGTQQQGQYQPQPGQTNVQPGSQMGQFGQGQQGQFGTQPGGQGTQGQYQPQPGQTNVQPGNQMGQFGQGQQGQFGNQPSGQGFGQGMPGQYGGPQPGSGCNPDSYWNGTSCVNNGPMGGQPPQGMQGPFPGQRGFGNSQEWGSEDKDQFNQGFQDQWEKEDEKNKQRQLKDMKMGVKGFQQGIKQFQKMVDKATKNGVIVPDTITQAFGKANSIISTVSNAKTLEEILDAPMDEMPDIMQVLQDGAQTLSTLQELPKIKKQFKKQMDSISRRLAKAERTANRAKIVVTNTVADIKSTLEQVQTAFDAFVASVQEGGDMEEFFSAMQDITEPYQTVNDKLALIESAAKSKNMVRNMKNKVNSYKREQKREAPGDETISSAISTFQSGVADLNSLLQDKEFNEEDFFDALEAVYEAEDAIIQAFADVTGRELPQPRQEVPMQSLFQTTGNQQLFQNQYQGLDQFMGPQMGPQMGPGGF